MTRTARSHPNPTRVRPFIPFCRGRAPSWLVSTHGSKDTCKSFPAIDLRDGKCVRLFQGDYDRETVFGDDPAAAATRWVAAGASRLHVVDLDGARDGVRANMAAVEAILAAVNVPVQLGGGIRSAQSAGGITQPRCRPRYFWYRRNRIPGRSPHNDRSVGSRIRCGRRRCETGICLHARLDRGDSGARDRPDDRNGRHRGPSVHVHRHRARRQLCPTRILTRFPKSWKQCPTLLSRLGGSLQLMTWRRCRQWEPRRR